MKELPQYHYDQSFDLNSIPRDMKELSGENHKKFLEENPNIGPHEGRTLALILLGKKALSVMARKHLVEALKDFITDGKIIVEKEKFFNAEEDTYIICRKDHIHYLEESKRLTQLIIKHNKSNNIPQLLYHEKKLGKLLGYFDKDIEFYCQRIFEEEHKNIKEGLFKNKLKN